MQNTYRFKLGSSAKADLKFDHYQKRGEYLGLDLHQNTDDSEIFFSASGAYEKKLYGDSNINPDTKKTDREYEGKVSFRNRLTFNRDSEQSSYNTTLRASVFQQSDYAYIQNFEAYRSLKPGFHWYSSPILYNDLYNQDVNKWYINLSDTRKNSSFYIRADWRFRWNPVLEEYKLNYANLPELSYSLNGILGERPRISATNSKTNTTSTNTTSGFYPKIRYNTSIKLSRKDDYNEDGEYLKSLDTRLFTLNLSRSFNLFRFISYIPSAGVGNQAYWAYDVDETEKENYERMSYSYGNAGQVLRVGPTRYFFNFSHSLKYRFEEPPLDYEYGKIVYHNLGISHTLNPLNGLRLSANTSYDLRTRRGEQLKGIERDRFSNLNSDMSLSAIKNIYFSARYIHSIRHTEPLTSSMNFNYSINNIPLILIDKVDLFRFSTLWNHNFQNPRNSKLNININLNLAISKSWSLRLATHSENEKLYLYSRSLARKYKVEETEKNAGEYEHRNFFADLLNSINIFQPSKMRNSYFKLKSANISVNHDLHCWEMAFGYTLSQRFFNYGRVTQYPYFEHSFWFRINMKIETELGMDEKFRTQPPRVER